MKPKPSRTRLFAITGTALLITGFALMVMATLGGRLASADAFPLPVGFATAAVGGMVLTRTPLGVFFLAAYALAMLILGITGPGWTSVPCAIAVLLLTLCLPLARRAVA